jgi:energy-coupling factor transport system substrate-specific component
MTSKLSATVKNPSFLVAVMFPMYALVSWVLRATGARPQPTTRSMPVKIPMSYIAAMVPICAALNLVGGYIITTFRIPIFLDMMGTCVCAFTVGPWWAAVTGIITNVGETILISPVYLPFAVINILGAIIWGYGARYLTKDFPRLLLLGVIAGFFTGICATPIGVVLFGGATGVPSDLITAAFLASGKSIWTADALSSVISNEADKIFSTFIAVAIVARLPKVMRGEVKLAEAPTTRVIAYSVLGIVIGIVLTALIALKILI